MDDKIDLKDVTFIIPIRIDSVERLDNLQVVTDYILSLCNTNIFVVEGHNRNTGIVKKILHPSIHYFFNEDDMDIFHRTRYINAMARLVDTSYVAVWDADVIIPSIQFDLSIKCLRNGISDMVIPYNGKFLETGFSLRNQYFSTKDMSVLEKNNDSMKLLFGSSATGGGFFIDKKEYQMAGMENENFFGWGMEDGERVKRLKILGFNISRINCGPMYHFSHPRGINSSYRSTEAQINATKEYLRICDMSKEELKIEIDKWFHMKET